MEISIKDYFKLIIIVVSFMSACQSTHYQNPFPAVINIDPEITRSIKRSEIFELDRIIWLDSNSQFPIVSRDGFELLAQDNRILVSSNSVGIFNQEGDFLNPIGAKGRGPGEYLTNFKIEICQDRIRLLDRSGQKFLDYNFEGQFIGSYSLGAYANNFTCIGDQTIVYMGYEPHEENKQLLLFNKYMKLTDSFFPMDLEKSRYMNAFSITNFFHYKDSVRFLNPFEYTIWDLRVRDNAMRVSPRFHIDFGQHAIPNDFYQQSFPSVFEYHQELAKRNYCHSIWAYWENEFNVFFIYSLGNQRLLGAYCKISKKSVSIDEIHDDILFWGIKMPVFDDEALYYYPVKDQVYFVMEAWKFRERMQKTHESLSDEQWQQYALKMPALIDIYEKTTDFDNPLIFVFNWKPFTP